MSGKGSKRRPTDDAAYASSYDRIFRSLVQPASNEQAEAKEQHSPADDLEELKVRHGQG